MPVVLKDTICSPIDTIHESFILAEELFKSKCQLTGTILTNIGSFKKKKKSNKTKKKEKPNSARDP